jgi:hypothetical protein
VLTEDRNEYPASLLRKRNNVNTAITLALHTTDQPLFVQSIDCYPGGYLLGRGSQNPAALAPSKKTGEIHHLVGQEKRPFVVY